MTNKERIEDLLTEFDEFGMQPTILVPDPEEMAKEWKHELEYAIRHLKSEIAREIIIELTDKLYSMRPHKKCLTFIDSVRESNTYELGREHVIYDILKLLDEIEKKYTEGK